MKRLLPLIFLGVFFGCSDNGTTVLEREMHVSPKILTFNSGETTKTVSIIHTCTCPFSWTCTITPPNGVLKDTTGTGDNTAIPINIADRSKMTSDTLDTKIVITSNGYGTDTIVVKVIR